MYRFLFFCALLFLGCAPNEDENSTDALAADLSCEKNTFQISLNADGCTIDIENSLGVASRYEENKIENREIKTNSIPNHRVGTFPNSGNPNTIGVLEETFTVTSNPQGSNSVQSAQGYQFGVLFSGVTLDPFTAEFFQQANGQSNRDWNITALTNAIHLGLDCNNAHVQPNGKYHYHGTPTALLEALDTNGEEMILVGYAADGFPIYYKYAQIDGTLTALESGYRLKEGQRPGDGQNAPDGCYDGTYFQDYEYVEALSPLDECNGMTGKTPEAESEYFYVITDNFPSSPLCFSGTPDDSFRNGPGPPRTAFYHHIVL
ncbi:MAG: YHYH protein [Flavobacteriaceae bacterium]